MVDNKNCRRKHFANTIKNKDIFLRLNKVSRTYAENLSFVFLTKTFIACEMKQMILITIKNTSKWEFFTFMGKELPEYAQFAQMGIPLSRYLLQNRKWRNL